MYILASVFFSKKMINTYLKLEIWVVCREFLAFKYVVIDFFRNKTEDYLYLYIRNLENSRLKPILNGYIVLSKNSVKCAIFKISDVQILFVHQKS